MASKYATQSSEPNRSETNKFLCADGSWKVPEGSGGASSLEDLTDVNIQTPTDHQALVYDETSDKWINGDSGATELNDLTDVAITNPTDGQTLLYNSTTHKFENANGGSANIPEYTYSYWLAHRAELEATGKPFIVTNAPPSPDLVAENIGYDNTTSGVVASNVQDALDGLFYLVAKKSVTVEGYHGLSALCQRYGEVVIITITGQTNAAITAGVDEIPIPEGYRPSDAYTHDFAVSYDTSWNITLGNIYNNNIRFRHNIASGVYVRGTCIYLI